MSEIDYAAPDAPSVYDVVSGNYADDSYDDGSDSYAESAYDEGTESVEELAGYGAYSPQELAQMGRPDLIDAPGLDQLLEGMVYEKMAAGWDAHDAIAASRQELHNWHAGYQARTAYEQHVANYAARQEAVELAHEIADDYGRKAGVPESERGALVAGADRLWQEAYRELYDMGRADMLELLNSPVGAELALENAAAEARQASAGQMAWSSEKNRGGIGLLDVWGNPEHAAWLQRSDAEWRNSSAGQRAWQRLAEWRDR